MFADHLGKSDEVHRIGDKKHSFLELLTSTLSYQQNCRRFVLRKRPSIGD